jgi:hypothetical protein
MICDTCGEECTPYQADVGWGMTEAWGVTHNDVYVGWFCDLCGSEVDYTPTPAYFDSV